MHAWKLPRLASLCMIANERSLPYSTVFSCSFALLYFRVPGRTAGSVKPCLDETRARKSLGWLESIALLLHDIRASDSAPRLSRPVTPAVGHAQAPNSLGVLICALFPLLMIWNSSCIPSCYACFDHDRAGKPY